MKGVGSVSVLHACERMYVCKNRGCVRERERERERERDGVYEAMHEKERLGG